MRKHRLVIYERAGDVSGPGGECVADIVDNEDLVSLLRTAYRSQRTVKGVTRAMLDFHIGGDHRLKRDLRLVFRGSKVVGQEVYIREEMARLIDSLADCI